MVKKIITIDQLQQLQNTSLIYTAIFCIAALLLAILISSLIKWQPGKDRSYIIRRIVFILLGLITPSSFFLYNELVVRLSIPSVGFQTMFMKTNILGTCIILVGYYLLGIILMFIFRNSKFGSILGKARE